MKWLKYATLRSAAAIAGIIFNYTFWAVRRDDNCLALLTSTWTFNAPLYTYGAQYSKALMT
jgi:hypothetical protein